MRPARPSRISRFLQEHRKVASESLRRLLKSPISSLMTIFVIAVSLLLPALLLGFSSKLINLLDEFHSSAQISLFLNDTVTDARGLAVSEDLLSDLDIDTVDFITRAQAMLEFSARSGFADILLELGDNPLPATIIVTPTNAALNTLDLESSPTDDLNPLLLRLQRLPEVSEIQVDSQWLQRLAAVSNVITVVGRLLAAIVSVSLFFIVGNTIKLAIESRKEEIKVIKLIGGTDGYIARPFLYAGLFYGGAGGLLAYILQTLVLYELNSSLQALLQLYESNFILQGFGLVNALILILAGSLIGWLAAFLASIRHILVINP